MTTFVIHPNLYPIPLRVIIGDREYVDSVIQKYYKGITLDTNESHEAYVTMIGMKSYNEVVMVLESAAYTCHWYSILAHESVHVAKYILDAVGVPFSSENDESIAYISGWTVKNILTRLRSIEKRSQVLPNKNTKHDG